MSDCGSLLSSYINLCPLTPNSKTHASIRMAPRSPCPPGHWAGQGQEESGWVAVGLWDRDMLMVHTAHFLPLYAAPSCQHTVSEGHPSSYGGQRQTSSSHWERWPASLNSRTTSCRLFGSTGKCSGLWEEMSDDSITPGQRRSEATWHARLSACRCVVPHLWVRRFLCL